MSMKDGRKTPKSESETEVESAIEKNGGWKKKMEHGSASPIWRWKSKVGDERAISMPMKLEGWVVCFK